MNPPPPDMNTLMEFDWKQLQPGDDVYVLKNEPPRKWVYRGIIKRISLDATGQNGEVLFVNGTYYKKGPRWEGRNIIQYRFFKVNPMPPMVNQKALVQNNSAAMELNSYIIAEGGRRLRKRSTRKRSTRKRSTRKRSTHKGSHKY